MRATITTTASALIAAYGQGVGAVQGLRYTSFGRSGLLLADWQTVFGIEQAGANFWLDTGCGRQRIGADEPLCLMD